MSVFVNKLKTRFTRLTHYEYWPFWLLYAPLYPYGVWLALRSWSFSYFTATNPCMRNGGAFAYSKFNILKQVNPKYLPQSFFFPAGSSVGEILAVLTKWDITYPFIIKPDAGERGKAVEKISNENELIAYLDQFNDDILIQDFVDFQEEFGVFYYRFPGEAKGHISSVTVKEFLKVTGDGTSRLGQLIDAHLRTQSRLPYLKSKYKNELKRVLQPGETMLLEPIGNHSRGTTFLNGSHLINEHLVKVFDEISQPMEGFYYGRFDLKVKSLDDLYKGENIRIVEVNGVNSEPTHIYDPKGNLFSALKDIAFHMKLIHTISAINHRNGVCFTPLSDVLSDLKDNLSGNPRHIKKLPPQKVSWT